MPPHSYDAEKLSAAEIGARLKVGPTAKVRSLAAQVHDAFEDVATTRLRDVFDAWDTDHGGSLSRAEFEKGMRALGARATKAQISQLFMEIDPDNSGQISYAELHYFFEAQREADARAFLKRNEGPQKDQARISLHDTGGR